MTNDGRVDAQPLRDFVGDLNDLWDRCTRPSHKELKAISSGLGQFYGAECAKLSARFPSKTAFSNILNNQRQELKWPAVAAIVLSCRLYAWENCVPCFPDRPRARAVLAPWYDKHQALLSNTRSPAPAPVPVAHPVIEPVMEPVAASVSTVAGPVAEIVAGLAAEPDAPGTEPAASRPAGTVPVAAEPAAPYVPGPDELSRRYAAPAARTDDSLALGLARTDYLAYHDAERPKLTRFMMWYGADLTTAERAAGRALVDAWELRDQPEEQQRIFDIRTWIRFRALTVHREFTGRGHASAASPHRPEPDMPVRALLAALRELPDTARAVVAFRRDGFSADVIADQLAISTEEVERELRAARERLAAVCAWQQRLRGGPGGGGTPPDTADRPRLEELLARADERLLDHVTRHADLQTDLARLMDTGAAHPGGPRAHAAVAAFRIRAKAHTLRRTLADAARSLADAVRQGRQTIRAGELHPRDTGRDRDLFDISLSDLERHLSQAGEAARGLALEFPFALSRNLEQALSAVQDLDGDILAGYRNRSLTGSLKRIVDNVAALEPQVGSARDRADGLIRHLHAMPVIAFGADLTALDLPDEVDVAAGVMWDDDTIWPAGFGVRLREHSRPLRDGAYEVAGDVPAMPRETWLVRPAVGRPRVLPPVPGDPVPAADDRQAAGQRAAAGPAAARTGNEWAGGPRVEPSAPADAPPQVPSAIPPPRYGGGTEPGGR